MSRNWLIDEADLQGFTGMTVLQLKRARLLRLSKVANLKKEARQVKQLRKSIEADIEEIDRLIETNVQIVQFPTADLPEKAPYERWPEEPKPVKRRA